MIPYIDKTVDNILVNKSVLYFENCISWFTNFLNQYKNGELTLTNEFTYEQDKVILKDRNKQWFIKFKNAHGKYNEIFLASGTAHFIGNFNLLDMLKADGFSISRMNASCEYQNTNN